MLKGFESNAVIILMNASLVTIQEVRLSGLDPIVHPFSNHASSFDLSRIIKRKLMKIVVILCPRFSERFTLKSKSHSVE